jgi:hypothetical protein
VVHLATVRPSPGRGTAWAQVFELLASTPSRSAVNPFGSCGRSEKGVWLSLVDPLFHTKLRWL